MENYGFKLDNFLKFLLKMYYYQYHNFLKYFQTVISLSYKFKILFYPPYSPKNHIIYPYDNSEQFDKFVLLFNEDTTVKTINNLILLKHNFWDRSDWIIITPTKEGVII
jgi:hypothetical protein